jgi:predicted alpha/beta-fold hydrolase
VDWLSADPATTPASETRDAHLLVLFHGLEGSSGSHYAQAFADFARERGMAFAVPHFRGCSGELNLGRGPTTPVILRRSTGSCAGFVTTPGRLWRSGLAGRQRADALGGEKWGRRRRRRAAPWRRQCSPIDLAAGGWAIGRGFNRLVYTRMFLNTMKPKALRKLPSTPDCLTARPCWQRA